LPFANVTSTYKQNKDNGNNTPAAGKHTIVNNENYYDFISKVKFNREQATKTQRGSRGTDLLFL